MAMSQSRENRKSRFGVKRNTGLSATTGIARIPVATGSNCSTASAARRHSDKLPSTVTTASNRCLHLVMDVKTPAAGQFHASSRAREGRLALLHEGAAAFGVVVAGEALLDQLGAARKIALALVAYGLVDDEFFGFHREWRVAGDGLGVVLDVGLELGCRNYTVDESHHARFLGIELAGR